LGDHWLKRPPLERSHGANCIGFSITIVSIALLAWLIETGCSGWRR
jgi:hypothetical protein